LKDEQWTVVETVVGEKIGTGGRKKKKTLQK